MVSRADHDKLGQDDRGVGEGAGGGTEGPFATFKLLKWIAEALERSSPQQAGVIPTEGPAAEGMEVVPVVIADVEWVQTPLFLRDSDLMDMLFALEANKDSEKDSGHGSGSEGNGREGNGSEGNGSEGNGSEGSGSDDRSFRAMDGDAMVK
jgi:hypothetical protein